MDSMLLLAAVLVVADSDDLVVRSFELELKALHYQCSVNMNPNACQKLREKLIWLEGVERGEEPVLQGTERT